MKPISIFDIFKIGVGPSSSHTLGPWKAASQFVKSIKGKNITTIEVHLYGSLSKTGRGHATDIAVQLGLEEYNPEIVDTKKINGYIGQIKSKEQINVNGIPIRFIPSENIIFHKERLKKHPNALTFKALSQESLLLEETYYSVGGGFIVKDGEDSIDENPVQLPFPISKAEDLLEYTNSKNFSISEVVYQNELVFRSSEEIKKKIQDIFDTMIDCVYRGCTTEGILPGGLLVKRRAKSLSEKLLNNNSKDSLKDWIETIKKSKRDFSTINKWVSCFAIAVNEENADLGRVVTSPTNGAAGVIPAVLLYYYFFCDNNDISDVEKFLMTSGEIGSMFKKGATLSAAVGGCQAEIGVSSAMAAGGLTEVLGGTPNQVLMAAEIAMEHHLGLTCDPIGGLVQIPCIERNSMGAIKAITASNLALSGNPEDAKVDFDVIVKTMWEVAQDMKDKYKETSEGGLAINVPVIFPDC